MGTFPKLPSQKLEKKTEKNRKKKQKNPFVAGKGNRDLGG